MTNQNNSFINKCLKIYYLNLCNYKYIKKNNDHIKYFYYIIKKIKKYGI